MVEREAAQELHLRCGDEVWPVARPGARRHAPAGERRDPAILHPGINRAAVAIEGRKEQFLVVAHQVDGGDREWAAGDAGDHPGAVGPTIDIVAKMDQDGVGAGSGAQVSGDQVVHVVKHVAAPMHIADGIGAVSGLHTARR